ncbi:hypothetical protein ACEUZ9_001082 [Paracoccus litorisediminis]|uniref:hypothetical protein n=1 Tax=Paracoccus litorisediminis TaxID=2006130 RepID=UPI00373120D0
MKKDHQPVDGPVRYSGPICMPLAGQSFTGFDVSNGVICLDENGATGFIHLQHARMDIDVVANLRRSDEDGYTWAYSVSLQFTLKATTAFIFALSSSWQGELRLQLPDTSTAMLRLPG